MDHQWRALDGQTVFGQYLVNDDRTIHAFYVWVCLWTNSIVCPRAPRQCLVQLILAMGTVQARNLSSETFQLGAAFFQGELVLSIDIYFDTN